MAGWDRFSVYLRHMLGCVLNPLITDSNKNSGIRKAKNDKSDKTSLLILKTYKTPDNILAAPKGEIVSLIALTSRKGLKYANEKYSKLVEAATLSKSFGHYLESVFELIQMHIEFIETFSSKIDSILVSIEKYTLKFKQHIFIKQIHLLDSINQGYWFYFSCYTNVRDW
ncbi:MAG: hypothetical protein ACLKAN_11415 [Alkaliphilus sp.]